jgi:hypothetical protein
MLVVGLRNDDVFIEALNPRGIPEIVNAFGGSGDDRVGAGRGCGPPSSRWRSIQIIGGGSMPARSTAASSSATMRAGGLADVAPYVARLLPPRS